LLIFRLKLPTNKYDQNLIDDENSSCFKEHHFERRIILSRNGVELSQFFPSK